MISLWNKISDVLQGLFKLRQQSDCCGFCSRCFNMGMFVSVEKFYFLLDIRIKGHQIRLEEEGFVPEFELNDLEKFEETSKRYCGNSEVPQRW